MARNRLVIAVPPETVFQVLTDPSTYSSFVVGTKRIRRFDPGWPDVGSVFHHTLGIGPLILKDLSRVQELEGEARLVLRAQMRPLAVNRVAFTLSPSGSGTEVEVEEYPIEGPMAAVWNPALDGLMWLRNQEMLRRLNTVATRRLASQFSGRRA